jgi:hypothetical protein
MTSTNGRSIDGAARGRRRRIGLALSAVPAGALLATTVLAVAPASADEFATSSAPGYYTTTMTSGYNGLCLDDQNSSTADYNPVQVWSCNGTDAQEWTQVTAGSTIQAFGMCLDIEGGGTTDGTPVDLYTCNDTGAQVWIPENGAQYNPQSGKCLDDTNGGGPGTQLQIWDCTGGANQDWYDQLAPVQSFTP